MLHKPKKVTECSICHNTFKEDAAPKELYSYILCSECYSLALSRVERFTRILLMPEERFNKWLDGD